MSTYQGTSKPTGKPAASNGNGNALKWSNFEKYLVGEYFKDNQEFVLTIRAVLEKPVYSQREQKEVPAPVLYFTECAQGFPITITANRRALARWFGDAATNAVGHRVKLKATPVKVGGVWKKPIYLIAQVDAATGAVVSDPLFSEPTIVPGDTVLTTSDETQAVNEPHTAVPALAEA